MSLLLPEQNVFDYWIMNNQVVSQMESWVLGTMWGEAKQMVDYDDISTYYDAYNEWTDLLSNCIIMLEDYVPYYKLGDDNLDILIENLRAERADAISKAQAL